MLAAITWVLIATFCMDIGIDQGLSVMLIKLFRVVSLTFILIGGATFCSNQSNKHRNSENTMRWFSLKIKAIDPFLASVENPQRAQAKTRLCGPLFSQFQENSGISMKNAPKLNMKDITSIISSAISSELKGTKT